MNTTLVGLLAGFAPALALGQERTKGPSMNLESQKLSVGATTAKIMPAAGCNVYSIEFQGRQILQEPKELKDLPGFMAGVPVLYPTPNRVRDGKFVFEGKTYTFTANNGPNFLHGLVHSAPWEFLGVTPSSNTQTAHYRLVFKPGSPWFELFPHPHTLKLDVRVAEASVRWTYTVDNAMGDKPVPFGFALHPWFLYQGSRAKTMLTIPTDFYMETKELLPTGKLLNVAGTKFDARKPMTLQNYVVDDVYFGLKPENPTVIDFQDAKLKITLSASVEFTHLVVYTPADKPHFCVENQSCSTDAHNLFAQGLRREANLIIVPPGKTQSGQIEFHFEKY